MIPVFADWDCRLSRLLVSDDSSAQAEAREAVSYLSDHCGIRFFAMTQDYDCRREPVSHLLLRKGRYEECFKRIFPSGSQSISVRPFVRAVLVPGLHQTPALERLLVSSRGYLPLVMPATTDSDWIDEELNRLLYTAKYSRLILASFEICMLLYSPEMIERLLRIPELIPQIGYRACSEPAIRRLLERMERQNRTVLFGTGVNSLQKAYQHGLGKTVEAEKIAPSLAEHRLLLQRSLTFWKR